MTEAEGRAGDSRASVPAPPAASPGALLRRARETRGLHVAALAAALKVPPRRLEALELDRWDELPDPAFTRALAQAVCRALKTDPAPVLALLPRTDANLLENVSGRINMPFRERPGQAESATAGGIPPAVIVVVVLMLVAAAALLWWPSSPEPAQEPGATVTEPVDDAVPQVAVPAVVAPAASAVDGTVTEPPTEATPPAAEAAPSTDAAPADAPASGTDGASDGAAAAPADAAAAPLRIRVAEDTWVELRDASGAVLVSRTLQGGETLALDPALPARLVVGNVTATEVLLRGERVDLGSQRRGNIARLELR